MSQVDNKVRWCLKKAEKEGKKHRGLIKTDPNLAEAKKHIAKAEHNFKAVIFFSKNGFSDWSASAVFYTIYHCFLAIIIKFGYESRNQECTIVLIEQLKQQGKIKISDEIIKTLKTTDHEEAHHRNTIELRENFQYGTETSMKDNILDDLKEFCKKALDETKEIVY